MNIVITLPNYLIEAIREGRKQYELRLCAPIQFNQSCDGFFVVEKGSSNVVCWCRVDDIFSTCDENWICEEFADTLAVPEDWIRKYLKGRPAFLWHIKEAHFFEKPLSLQNDLYVDRNPQSFAYCPFSHGRSY